MNTFIVYIWVVWIVGTLLVWPFWYFGGGFSKAKRHYGIDWRQFRWSYLGRCIAWPYFLIRWFLRRGSGEELRAVVYIDGQEVREYLSTAEYAIDDKCVAYTRSEIRTEPLPESSICPFCAQDLAKLNRKDTADHFLTNHVDDQTPGQMSGLQLACGCPHVQWPYDNFRAEEIVPHLKREHGFNQRATSQPQPTAQVAAADSGNWYSDPTGRHEFRWWDGSQWTQNVSDQGQTSVDNGSAREAS